MSEWVKECRKCKYVCVCCSSRIGQRCSGCDRYDEFELAEHIEYCPLNGKKLEIIAEEIKEWALNSKKGDEYEKYRVHILNVGGKC